MTAFVSGLPLNEAEQVKLQPIGKIVDRAILAKGHKRKPLQSKSEKVGPKLTQSYSSRGSSDHRRAYARMVGSE